MLHKEKEMVFYGFYVLGLIFVSCQAVLQTSEDLESGYVGGWWLSLGIKSPFVEFTTEFETLSNDTTYFNFTQHMNVIQSKQMQTVTSPTTTPSTTTMAAKTTIPAVPKRLTLNIGGQTADFLALFGHHPSLSITPPTHFTTEIPDKTIRIVETQERAEALQSEPKKYIIPLALKTTSTEKEKKSTVFQDTSLHIDDLKNHILMLQNFAQADKTFQSKFVVFPHLSNETTTSTTTEAPTTPPRTTSAKKVRINSRNLVRISTTAAPPQVFLQNDQSSADDPEVESDEEKRKLEKRRRRKERKNLKRTQSPNMGPSSRANHSRKSINKAIRNERDETKANFKRSKVSRNRRASSKLRKKSILNTIDVIEKQFETSSLDPKLCYIPDVLSYGQQKLCGTNINVMPVVSRAARSALQNCKMQFKNRRWDCQTIDDPTVFGPIISIGSSEMAYVHALSSASLMSFVARACRDGAFNTCGCSKSKRPKTLKDQWVWGGCGDDFEFAYKFTQRFVDSREKELRRLTRAIVSAPPKEIPKILEQELNLTDESAATSTSPPAILSSHEDKHGKHKGRKGYTKFNTQLEARSLMNLHNNEAGRRAVVKKSRINCKCHGVSGSCSVITCWQQLTSIKDIAEYLKEKYDSATQVRMNQRKKLQVRDYRRTIPNAEDLVYIENSPDWCRPKNNWWKGTQGRVCNRNSKGPDSCFGNNICCGRGFNTRKVVVREKCNCKFHWCCTVKCRTCVKTIEEYTCK
ncbi:protein Wnt-5 [Culicoides brevitarsis]|uniref:protein Wnt-5 n=1 Tax=Culicoides brevitarsis TaxID=469753 RepID=UPI00307B6670